MKNHANHAVNHVNHAGKFEKTKKVDMRASRVAELMADRNMANISAFEIAHSIFTPLPFTEGEGC